MKSSIRQPAIDVPVPVQVFNDLCAYRERSGDRRDLALLAGTAIAHLRDQGDLKLRLNGLSPV